MRLSRRNQRETFTIDLTTCSDIIFTLLIFYILTQSFVTQVPMHLPQLKSELQTISQKPTQIEISASGQISWNSEVLPADWEDALKQRITTVAASSSFLIMTHKQAPAGVAIELLDRLRLAGIENVSLGGMPYKKEEPAGSVR